MNYSLFIKNGKEKLEKNDKSNNYLQEKLY